MARTKQAARKSILYLWRSFSLKMVDLEPSNSSSDFDDKVPKIIEFSSDSNVEEFLEFELVEEVEPMMDLDGPGEVDFEDPEADKPRKKQRIDGHDSDNSDAFGDYEITEFASDSEDNEEDLYAGEDPYFISDSERDFDSYLLVSFG
jgi:hypothetical protein